MKKDASAFALPRLVGRGHAYALLALPAARQCSSVPLPPAAWGDLSRAVEALQRRKMVHRAITPATVFLGAGGRHVLGGLGSALDVRRALRRGAFATCPTRPCAPELCLLAALELLGDEGALTAPLLREALADHPGAEPYFAALVGAPQAVARRALVAGWRTWDLYALASLFPPNEARRVLLHPDPAQRLRVL